MILFIKESVCAEPLTNVDEGLAFYDVFLLNLGVEYGKTLREACVLVKEKGAIAIFVEVGKGGWVAVKDCKGG